MIDPIALNLVLWLLDGTQFVLISGLILAVYLAVKKRQRRKSYQMIFLTLS